MYKELEELDRRIDNIQREIKRIKLERARQLVSESIEYRVKDGMTSKQVAELIDLTGSLIVDQLIR